MVAPVHTILIFIDIGISELFIFIDLPGISDLYCGNLQLGPRVLKPHIRWEAARPSQPASPPPAAGTVYVCTSVYII